MTNLRSTKIIAYVVVIFCAGLVSGILLSPRVGHMFLRPPGPAEMSRHMLERMQTRLDLTPEQSAAIKPLLEAASADLSVIRHETTERVSSRIAQTNESISALLNPEQRQELARMEAERKEHMSRHEPFAPAPPPPPPRR